MNDAKTTLVKQAAIYREQARAATEHVQALRKEVDDCLGEADELRLKAEHYEASAALLPD